MNVIDSIILGIIQGLTEFLPVSSSGHLVISQSLLKIDSPGILMEVSLHIGTLIAICAVFWRDILLILCESGLSLAKLASKKRPAEILAEHPNANLAVMIIAGTIPTVIIGLLFEDAFERLFSSPVLVGAMLIVTGVILWLTKLVKINKPGNESIGFLRALIIGTVQGMAIMPGISRSGSTIAAASFMGIERSMAARFSFLLSLPAIMGAAVLKFSDVAANNVSVIIVAIGTITATIIGYFALRFLVNIINKGKFYVFSYYCWALGVFTIIRFVL